MQPPDLTAWRAAHGLSRREAGEVLGVPAKTLEGLEYGRYPHSALWGPISRIIAIMEAQNGQNQITTPDVAD